jgi:imidazolonepropionase-like amidohydrolase
MGTDSGGPGGLHGAGVPREMELLNDCGLTPMQVIMAATRGAAAVIGQGESLGTLEAGKLADAIVIDGDPLRDINNIRRLVRVIRDGKLIDPNALAING